MTFEFDFSGHGQEPEPKPANVPLGDFFDLVFMHAGSGWVCLTTWPGGTYNSEAGGPTVEHWFAWPEHKDRMTGFALANKAKDVYFVPALFETKSNRRAKNISGQSVVYADADRYQEYKRNLRVPPSIVVSTGPVNAHLYWIIEDEQDPKKLAEIAKSVAYTHAGSGMDKGGWDGGQLLRVPGTFNNKVGIRRRVEITELSGESFNLDQLAEKYPPLVDEFEATELGAMPDPKTWPSEIEMADFISTKPHLVRLYTEVVNRGEGDRSDRVYALLSALRRDEVEPLVMLAAGWYSGSNKYRQEARPPEEFWREVTKAYNDPANTPAANAWEFEDAFDRAQARATGEVTIKEQRTAALTFLSAEEQKKVPFDTFIDDYVVWTRGLTDAVAAYQKGAALTILSCVYGEYGVAPSAFHLPLTLWFMAMGPSTRSRKSTALRIMVRLLDEIADGEYFYALTDDATPEGLANAIKERPEGVTSLFYRDELHGLLHEEKHKKYMAGLQTLLTQLYDGYNRARIRAGQKEDKTKGSGLTNFPIYGTGVFHNTADSLSHEDFISGHLARFIYILGEPGEMTEASEWLGQVPATKGIDMERGRIADALRLGRNYWDSKVERGKPVRIMTQPCACKDLCSFEMCTCEDCPWRRWNAFAFDMKKTALGYEGFEDALGATADRLAKSALKVACLLAMHDRYEYVQMHHMYKAMDLSAEWFQHMVLVAHRIKSSERLKLQDEIVGRVAAKGEKGATKMDLYRPSRGAYDVGQFDQHMQALLLSGLIHKHNSAVQRASGSGRATVERFYHPLTCPHD